MDPILEKANDVIPIKDNPENMKMGGKGKNGNKILRCVVILKLAKIRRQNIIIVDKHISIMLKIIELVHCLIIPCNWARNILIG